MHTETSQELGHISWKSIMTNSERFEQNPFNSRIFTLKFLADIATRGDEIVCIHPLDRETLDRVAEELGIAASQYYGQNVSVSFTDDLIIKVKLTDVPKETF